MNEGLSMLAALLLLSAMLSTILTIAWVTLGRERHALTWAIAFGVAAVQWGFNLVYLLTGNRVLFCIVNMLAVAVAALIAHGFRQRSGAPDRRLALMAGGGVTVGVGLVTTFLTPYADLADAAPLLFRAVVLAGAAAVVVPAGRRGNAAERSAAIMLWGFALFSIAVAAVALTISGGDTAYAELDRRILLLGLPTAFAGTGLFAVFLLAADLAERMRRLASRDPLTGALNRRGFAEAADRAVANAIRQRQPLSLALADLDRFKAVNDAHGHAAGDTLLCRFAAQMGEAVRQGDLFGRLGGEEFVLLLVNTPGEAAVTVIDRLRHEVARQTLATDPPTTVTTSFGVAELAPGEVSLSALIARADKALYRAKQDGRDCVRFAGAA